MSRERERLAGLIYDADSVAGHFNYWLDMADYLLSKGVTLNKGAGGESLHQSGNAAALEPDAQRGMHTDSGVRPASPSASGTFTGA